MTEPIPPIIYIAIVVSLLYPFIGVAIAWAKRRAMIEAGAGVLRKPCREAELLEEIRKQLGLEYTYEAGTEPDFERTSQIPMLMVKPETHVRKLPPALVAGLREAARVADYEKLLGLIHEIPSELSTVGEALRELVQRYDYYTLILVLGSPA